MEELTEHERENLLTTFDRYDRNGNGTLDWDEFCLLVDELIGSMPLDEKSLAFQLADGDHTGVITFEEFIDWWYGRT